jgi:plastocyanin
VTAAMGRRTDKPEEDEVELSAQTESGRAGDRHSKKGGKKRSGRTRLTTDESETKASEDESTSESSRQAAGPPQKAKTPGSPNSRCTPAWGMVWPLALAFFVGLVLALAITVPLFLSVLSQIEDGKSGDAKDDNNSPSASAAPPAASFTFVANLSGYYGQGGAIDGVRNPRLPLVAGQTIQITMINGDGLLHDVVIEGSGHPTEPASAKISGVGTSTTLTFSTTAAASGDVVYYCSIPGHRAAGMEGIMVSVGRATAPPDPTAVASVVKNPADLPPPLNRAGGQRLSVVLGIEEKTAYIDSEGTFDFWTYNGTVPGPLVRVVEGDIVDVTLTNPATSLHEHSVDFHAVTGPGGGAAATRVPPGTSRKFRFRAQQAGLYVYHCASTHVPTHISAGMYGLILVEPAGGVTPGVDKEFYVMQGEMYLEAGKDTQVRPTRSLNHFHVHPPLFFVTQF